MDSSVLLRQAGRNGPSLLPEHGGSYLWPASRDAHLCSARIRPVPFLFAFCMFLGNSWHALFALGNISRANGPPFTRSNQAGLVNTRMEVREMWFTLCSKVLTSYTPKHSALRFFPQPLIGLSPPKPQGLEGTITALGVLSSFLFSLHPRGPVFIVNEMPDFLHLGRKNQGEGPLPRKPSKKPSLAFWGSTSLWNTRRQEDMGKVVHFLQD